MCGINNLFVQELGYDYAEMQRIFDHNNPDYSVQTAALNESIKIAK